MLKKEKQIKTNKPMYTYEFMVKKSDTLMTFLISKLPKMSRNNLKSLLSRHKVSVNGKMISQFNYPLAKEDEVKISKSSLPSSIKTLPTKEIKAMRKIIIYEDDDYLAINKPSGLLAIEDDKNKECAYRDVANYLALKGKTIRPYVVHRIDRDTSGVLVFVKNIKLHSLLRLHWNENVELREYYAVVNGKCPQERGTLVNYLKENANNMMLISDRLHGKKAITNYEVLKENAKYSLLRLTILTGRKNQIRVQLKHLGCPVVGDQKYSDGFSPFKRLGLHASQLIFTSPVSKKEIKLKAPLPNEFYQLFEK